MNQKLRCDAELRATLRSGDVATTTMMHHRTIAPPPPSSSFVVPHLPTTTPPPRQYHHNHQHQHQYQLPSQPHHLQSPTIFRVANDTTTTPPTTTTNTTCTYNDDDDDGDIASRARQEWQQHGTRRTQILEDLRYGRNHHHHYFDWKVGKVVRAEDRVDITGAPYTTYIIQLWDRSSTLSTSKLSSSSSTTNVNPTNHHHHHHHPENDHLSSMQVLERRYSDFYKLYQALVVNDHGNSTPNTMTYLPGPSLSHHEWYSTMSSIFPQKHWSGRIGNWTPAKYLAPQQYHDTIQERIQALDAWLVYVLYAYNNNNNHHRYPSQQQQQSGGITTQPLLSEIQHTMVHDFISTPHPSPPYLMRTLESSSSTTTTTTVQYHNPVTFTLSSALRQATTTIQIMTRQMQQQQHSSGSMFTTTTRNTTSSSSPTTIPIDLLQVATGIVFLTVAKVGLIVSGRVGTGLFLAKLCHGRSSNTADAVTTTATNTTEWSAPVAVGTIGLGWGAVVGGDVTHYMIVCTTEDAVRDFGRNHTVQLGTEVAIAVGPTGMAAGQQIQSKSSKHVLEYHSTYAYAISSGLFLGVTLEGSMIRIRHDVNAKFYGQSDLSVGELLQSPGVPAAQALYEALDIATQQVVPEHALFKPSRYLPK